LDRDIVWLMAIVAVALIAVLLIADHFGIVDLPL
jgi:hypothetical protein